MNIIKNLQVRTGNIVIVEGEKNMPLEFLSIGDYGKEKNIKADFLGITRELNGVLHGDILPLTEKWVTTISTQYGCSMNCKFCDVPLVGKGVNATMWDMIDQVKCSLSLHPEITTTKRFNLHYARMGEPTFNLDLLSANNYLHGFFKEKGFNFHPVISTMMPKHNKHLATFIQGWMRYKNEVANGEAGLQISINTTCDNERNIQFGGNAMTINDMFHFFTDLFQYEETPVVGRKIALNIALSDAPVSAGRIVANFNPKYFMVKITPMHMTKKCVENKIITEDGYVDYHSYKKLEKELKECGFDVLVFIPSLEEDEDRITCGNAILSDFFSRNKRSKGNER